MNLEKFILILSVVGMAVGSIALVITILALIIIGLEAIL